MATKTFKNGAHRTMVNVDHKSRWIKFTLSDGHDVVHATLTYDQAEQIMTLLEGQIAIAKQLAQRERMAERGAD